MKKKKAPIAYSDVDDIPIIQEMAQDVSAWATTLALIASDDDFTPAYHRALMLQIEHVVAQLHECADIISQRATALEPRIDLVDKLKS